jgi:hypothetical protein
LNRNKATYHRGKVNTNKVSQNVVEGRGKKKETIHPLFSVGKKDGWMMNFASPLIHHC